MFHYVDVNDTGNSNVADIMREGAAAIRRARLNPIPRGGEEWRIARNLRNRLELESAGSID